MEFVPTEVRYIKLGEGECHAGSCIEGNGVEVGSNSIRLGCQSELSPELHDRCLRGEDDDWDAVLEYRLKQREGNFRAAHDDHRQIREFYQLPNTTLWFTFFNDLLWWCFAAERVSILPDQSRVRKTLGGWHSASIDGKPLAIESLDGRFTQVRGCEGVICRTQYQEYLIRRIRGEDHPDVVEAKVALANIHRSALNLIKGLWWQDFEVLAELILAKAGWQRVSVLEKTENDADIAMLSLTTGRRAFVRVKSQADFSTLQESIELFKQARSGDLCIYDEMFFVVRTTDRRVLSHAQEGITILGLDKLTEQCVSLGLMPWLLLKRS